jgi:hypothetical protein
MTVQTNNGASPQHRSTHQQSRSQPQSEPQGNPNRPPRSEANPGTSRSAQRPVQPIGSPKIQGRQIAAWGKVAFASAFWVLLAGGLILAFLYFTVVNLLPAWVWNFNEMAKLVTANLELYPRTVFWILGFSTVMATIAYSVIQGYQSAGQLKKHFGIVLPAQATFDELRNFSYGVEAVINFTYVFGRSVGGWTGNMSGDGARLLGYILSNPIKAIVDVLWIAMMTMMSEWMIGLACLAIVAAMQAIRANAGVAAKQAAVTSARPQQWTNDRGSQRPAQTVDVEPTKSAQPQPESKKQQDREQNADRAPGEFFQDQNNAWKYMITDMETGKQRSKIADKGAKITFDGVECTLIWNHDQNWDGGWKWEKSPTPEAPTNSPRPQRRTAAEQQSTEPVAATQTPSVNPATERPARPPRRPR